MTQPYTQADLLAKIHQILDQIEQSIAEKDQNIDLSRNLFCTMIQRKIQLMVDEIHHCKMDNPDKTHDPHNCQSNQA